MLIDRDETKTRSIPAGAHGRFQPRDGAYREARVQTLEPDNWMIEVERDGHATRRRTQLTQRAQ